jgi:hypothetical protein
MTIKPRALQWTGFTMGVAAFLSCWFTTRTLFVLCVAFASVCFNSYLLLRAPNTKRDQNGK